MRQKPTRCLLKSLSAGLVAGELMIFERGNRAAAKRNKKAVAKIIYQRIQNEGADLPITQLTALTKELNKVTAQPRRRRHGKQPKAEAEKLEFRGSCADRLPEEEKVILREILQIEAEQLEARRKKWHDEHEANQQEQKPTPPESIEPALPVAPSGTRWLLKADV
jgi:hypothetical protein